MIPRARALACAAFALLVAGCGASVLPQVHDNAGRIEVAKRLYAKGDIALALEVLQPFASGGGGAASGRADEGVYWMGMCHLREKEFASAQGDFERLLRDFPESDSAASASYRLGQALYGQSRGPDFDQEFTLKALQQWMEYRRDNPDHWLASEATKRIAECRTRLATKLARTGDLYVKLKLYEPAKLYYRSVLEQYSETPAYGDAVLGLAEADARLGARDSALATLQSLEQEFAGRPLGERAARLRSEIAKWKNTPARVRPLNKPNEPPPPPTPAPGGAE